MQPTVILKKLDNTLKLGVKLHDTSVVALRHHDRSGKMHVVTMLGVTELGDLTLDDRQLFGEKPVMLGRMEFKRWLDRYNASASMGLQRYICLKQVGIPFTSLLKVPHLLECGNPVLRSSIGDLVLKFDLENAEALLNVGKQAGIIDVSGYNGRHLSGRWFAFDALEDAALAKLKFATKDARAYLIEL